jgi:hypothetical protein
VFLLMKNIGSTVVVLFLLAGSTAYAQSDFRPGYVLSLTGDTLQGQVDYRGARLSSRLCRFRPTATAEVVEYGPSQVRGYAFPGSKAYEARLIVKLNSEGQPSPARQVFAEVIVAGPGTLYRCRDDADDADHYYVALASWPLSTPLPELAQRRQLVEVGGTMTYSTQNLYRGKLAELTAACPAVQTGVGSLPFTASALSAFMQRYNACVAPNQAPAKVVRATRSADRFQFGVLLGAQVSTLSFEGDIFLANGNFKSSVRPVAGLSLQVPLPSLNEKLSLRLEALVEQQLYEDAFMNGYGFLGGNSTQRVKMDLLYVRVPLMLRYTFPQGRLQPFLQAGMSYARGLRLVNELELGYPDRNGVVVYEPKQNFPSMLIGDLGQYEYGFIGSLGFSLPPLAGRPLTFELRFERSSGLVNSSGFGGYNQRLFALLGYSLTK